MSCKSKSTLNEQTIVQNASSIPAQIDRSVAYEMINDYGAEAFLKVVRQYQENIAKNLSLLDEGTGQQGDIEQLWALQYIRNCSAQLGLSAVSLHCKLAMDELHEGIKPNARLSDDEYHQFEKIIDCSVESLRALCTKMK